MPFEPGQSGNPLGRPKGSCNKTRRAVGEWATGIVEDPEVQARLLADARALTTYLRSGVLSTSTSSLFVSNSTRTSHASQAVTAYAMSNLQERGELFVAHQSRHQTDEADCQQDPSSPEDQARPGARAISDVTCSGLSTIAC